MAKECRPSQDGCSRGGTGPSCSQSSKLGGEDKRQCLEEAKEQCEEALKECLEKCKEELEEKRTSTSGNSSLIGGYYQRNKNPSKNPVDTTIRGVEPYGVGNETPFNEMRVTSSETTIAGGMRQEAECVRECYEQAASDCRTVQCYCGALKCGQFDPSRGGMGGDAGVPPAEPEPDEPWNEDFEENQLTEVSFETTSSYGIPIEIVYSRAYLPGNVLWIGEPRSFTSKSIAVSRNYDTRTITTKTTVVVTTVVDMFVGLCAGTVDSLLRVYLDGQVDYDIDDSSISSSANYTLYKGADAQKVREELARAVGFGRAPAHRDTCYLACSGMNLTSKKEFPIFSVEVSKSSSRTDAIESSGAFPDKDTSIIWHVEESADRLYFGTSTGVRCVDISDLSTVYDITVADALEVTPLGRILTYDGTSISVYEPATSTHSGSYIAALPLSQSFLFRTPSMFGGANLSLISQSGSGDTVVDEISEVLPQFPTDSVAIRELASLDSSAHTLALSSDTIVDSDTGDAALFRSVFLLRVRSGAFDTVRVRELRLLGLASDSLLEDESWYEYDIPEVVFGNTNTLQLFGGFVSLQGDIVLFAANGSLKYIVRWNPRDGVVWTTNVPNIPSLGRYGGSSRATDEYSFISGTTAYSLDVSNGVLTTEAVSGTLPALGGKQFYLPHKQLIVYEDANGGITKARLRGYTAEVETMRDAVRDIAQRASLNAFDFDMDPVADITINGYRSGDTISAANILQTLCEVYLVRTFSDERVSLRLLSTGDEVSVAAEDVILSASKERRVAVRENQTLSVGYFSDDALGETATQTFTIDRDSDRQALGEESTRSWTVLEHDLYMRRLVEIIAHAEDDKERVETFILPPRYLSIAPGDIAGLAMRGRVTTTTLGANNFSEIIVTGDTPEKYTDAIPSFELPRVDTRLVVSDSVRTLAAPMAIVNKGVSPVRFGRSSQVFAGLSDIDGAFEAPVTLSRSVDEYKGTPSGDTFRLTDSMLWGRVEIVPTEMSSTEEFRTFRDHSVSIRMYDQAMATRILNRANYYGQYPDRRTVDVYYNLLVVGKELIQYGYATAAGSVVTFHDLLRCRHNTDTYKNTHVAGEIAIVYDAESCGIYEISDASIADSVALVGSSPGVVPRRFDVAIDERDYAPCHPGYIVRRDDYVESRDLFGRVNFSGYTTNIYLRTRSEHPEGLTSERVSLNYTLADSVLSYPMYAIRGEYDETLFESERFGTDTSYVFLRLHTGDASLDSTEGSPYVAFMGRVPVYGGPTIPVNTVWDYNNEPLTIVLIHTNEYGENRQVYTFPVGIHTQKTRALLV